MPKYTVTARGGLLGKQHHPEGTVLEMSEADALSLPPGTVAAVKAEAPTPTPTPAPKALKEKKP